MQCPVYCFLKKITGVAVEILKERFGDIQNVVNCHYTEVINITPAINNSKGLWQLYDQIEKHLRSLVALNKISIRRYLSLYSLLNFLRIFFATEIQKGAKNKWTFGKLRKLFNDYVLAREDAEQDINTGISTSRQQASHPLRLSTEALTAGPRAQNPPNKNSKFSDYVGSVT